MRVPASLDRSHETKLEPIVEPTAGLSGAPLSPVNRLRGLAERIVRRHWSLLDRVAQRRPKPSELVTFRRLVPGIDPTPVDGATLEALVTSRRLGRSYEHHALVYNRGPDNLGELLAPGRRLGCGPNVGLH